MRKEHFSFLTCIVAAFLLTIQACSSSDDNGPTLTELIPAAGEVSGWAEEDRANRTFGAPDVANTVADAAANLDFNGAANWLEEIGFVAVAEEYYQKAAVVMTVCIVELSSTQDAQAAYEILETYSGPTYTDTTLGAGETEARMGEGMDYWRIEATKSKYFIATEGRPKDGENIQQETENFMRAILNKIP